ncbi:MAG: restriction endonuclease subunit S [Bacteroidia bacterium]|nr:MAG: restriction endonuclease subunit S [Bacteroidia bacterium]
MKTYNEYKDSGIEWLGQIPAHWEVKKLNYACKYQIGGTPPTGNSDSFYGKNKWLNISDIGDCKYIFDTEKRISDNTIKDNNILISPKGGLLFSFKLSIGQVCFVGTELYTNEAVATFLPSSKIKLDYAYYMFPICVVKNAKQNIYGADLLNQELIANAKICYPPYSEQQQIADYLDQQTSKIDNLVQKQNKLIELLQEKKKSLINHIVTKGLNSDVQMRDSGIEWLGLIPEHWEVKKLKYLATVRDVKQQYINDYEYIGLENIESWTGKYVLSKGEQHIDGLANLCFSGDVLFGKLRPYLAKCLIANSQYLCSTEILVLNSVAMISKLLQYHMLSENFINDVNGSTYGTKMPRTNWEYLSNIKLPYPPIAEQQQITEYLDQQTVKIDQLINKAKSMIELLKEHKQSLINNVVTGKIKVIDETTL